MKKTLAFAVLALGLASAPSIASAADAWTRSAVNLRAGPAADYPRITTLRAGQAVEVHGCINDWSWCDVSAGGNGNRGWVSASYLDYGNNGQRRQISGHGASLGLQVVSFVLGTYWDQHYRNKSWYGQRAQMANKHPRHAGQGGASQSGTRSTSARGNSQQSRQPQPAAQSGQASSRQSQPSKPQGGNQDRNRDDDRKGDRSRERGPR